MGTEMNMFFDMVNIAVAAVVIILGVQAMSDATGRGRSIVVYATVAALIIFVVELTGFLSVFPRDSFIQDALYELDLVMSLLLLGIIVKAKKK